MKLPLGPFVILASVISYSYTGLEYSLYPAMGVMLFFVVIHILGLGGLLTKMGREHVANHKEGEKDLGMSFLFQISMLIAAYQVYLIGFAVFAGAVLVHSSTVLVSLFITKLLEE